MNPEFYDFANMRNYYQMNPCYGGNVSCNKQLMPLNTMTSKLHIHVHTKVLVSVNKLIQKNMGKAPLAISIEEYKGIINEVLVDLTKEEDKIMKMLQSRCTYEEDRGNCTYCNGMLKTLVEVVLFSSLLSNGCMYCY